MPATAIREALNDSFMHPKLEESLIDNVFRHVASSHDLSTTIADRQITNMPSEESAVSGPEQSRYRSIAWLSSKLRQR